MQITHLTASTYYGGPERQMLGLADHVPASYRSQFISFAEGGRCESFLEIARARGHQASQLQNDTPRFRKAIGELVEILSESRTEVLCCHGYKAGLLGRIAARRCRIPVIAVSRGWTGQNLKVKVYDLLDRVNLHWMDQVVCVSQGQANKVRKLKISASKVSVIHNSIDTGRFLTDWESARRRLVGLFPTKPSTIVGAVGRLSPEKGFDLFVRAAIRLRRRDPVVGFIHFGDGPMREELQRLIDKSGLQAGIVLAGCRSDLDTLIPGMDLTVLPSYTEGLPNAVLESLAARVAVVATAVGGTPELIRDGETGFLVSPGNLNQLCDKIAALMGSPNLRKLFTSNGFQLIRERFGFQRQAKSYQQLFQSLTQSGTGPRSRRTSTKICKPEGLAK